MGTRVYDAQEIQKLIPQLEEAIEKKDRLLRQAQCQIDSQIKQISTLETEVKNLQVISAYVHCLRIQSSSERMR